MLSRISSQLVLIIAVGVIYLPFVNKAFHIDDRIYLETAKQILQDPLFPYDYAPLFEGLVTPDAASHSHLPLTAYYLALIDWITGSQQEWIYHLAFLVFPLLAAFSFYDLARRYVRFPLVAALLLLAAPAFTVLGQTLMPDVPLLAFWLCALSRFLRVVEGGGRKETLLLALALLGACMISLLSAGLLLLMGVYLWQTKGSREEGSFPLWVFLLPLVFWVAWYARAYLHYDRLVLVNTFLHMSKRETFDWALFGIKFVSFLLNLGAVFLCPLALWYGLSGRWRSRFALLAFFLAFVPFAVWTTEYTFLQSLLFALFLSSGFLVIWEFFLLRWESPEQWLLFFWFFGILAACLLLFYAGSVRYTLTALPPVILIWIQRLELRVKSSYLLRNLVWTGFGLTLLYSVPIVYSDYVFAGLYRRDAAELYERYQGPDRQIWIAGEWGFRYYFEQRGARPLPRTADLAEPGDIIIKPFVASPWVTLYDGDRYTRLLEQKEAEGAAAPLRLLDFGTHAGFYSTGWGLLPFSLSDGERWEWFNVFRVERSFDGEIPEAEQHF